MNKAEIIDGVAERSGLSKTDAKQAVNATIDTIVDGLNSPGDTVSLTGFGNFELKEQPAREGRNPSTGEAITIPAKNAVKFKPGKALKDAVQ